MRRPPALARAVQKKAESTRGGKREARKAATTRNLAQVGSPSVACWIGSESSVFVDDSVPSCAYTFGSCASRKGFARAISRETSPADPPPLTIGSTKVGKSSRH